jgi:hypothetical protein
MEFEQEDIMNDDDDTIHDDMSLSQLKQRYSLPRDWAPLFTVWFGIAEKALTKKVVLPNVQRQYEDPKTMGRNSLSSAPRKVEPPQEQVLSLEGLRLAHLPALCDLAIQATKDCSFSQFEEMQDPLPESIEESLQSLVILNNTDENNTRPNNNDNFNSSQYSWEQLDSTEEELAYFTQLQSEIEQAANLILSAAQFLASQCSDHSPLIFSAFESAGITNNDVMLSSNKILACLTNPRRLVEVRHFGSVMRCLLPLIDIVMDMKVDLKERCSKILHAISPEENNDTSVPSTSDENYVYTEAKPPFYVEIAAVETTDIPGNTGSGAGGRELFSSSFFDNHEEGVEDNNNENNEGVDLRNPVRSRLDVIARIQEKRKKAKQSAAEQIVKLKLNITISNDEDDTNKGDEMNLDNPNLSKLERNKLKRTLKARLQREKSRVLTSKCGLDSLSVKYLLMQGVLKPHGTADAMDDGVRINEDGTSELASHLTKDSLKALPRFCCELDMKTLKTVCCPHCTEDDIDEIIMYNQEEYFEKHNKEGAVFDISRVLQNEQGVEPSESNDNAKIYAMLANDWVEYEEWVKATEDAILMCNECLDNIGDDGEISFSPVPDPPVDETEPNDEGDGETSFPPVPEPPVDKTEPNGSGDNGETSQTSPAPVPEPTPTPLPPQTPTVLKKIKLDTFAKEANMALEDVEYLCEMEFLKVGLALGQKRIILESPIEIILSSLFGDQPDSLFVSDDSLKGYPTITSSHIRTIKVNGQGYVNRKQLNELIANPPPPPQTPTIPKKIKLDTFAKEANMSLEDVEYLCENQFLPVGMALGQKRIVIEESVESMLNSLFNDQAIQTSGNQIQIQSSSFVSVDLFTSHPNILSRMRVIKVNGKDYVKLANSIDQTSNDFQMSVETIRYLIDIGVFSSSSQAQSQPENAAEEASDVVLNYLEVITAIEQRLVSTAIIAVNIDFDLEEMINIIESGAIPVKLLNIGDVKYVLDTEVKEIG